MAAGIGKTRAPKRLPIGSLPPVTVAGFSGGKDSTAMVMRLAELGEDFACLFTPTGNELPALKAHMQRVMAEIAPREMVLPPNRSLAEWIDFYGALPNWRQRWCTRQIKVAPCAAYLAQRPGSTLLVGLRADEPEREGLYGPYANYRYPLREWGWGLAEVWGYLESRGVDVPARTDCAVCPYQRLGEWFASGSRSGETTQSTTLRVSPGKRPPGTRSGRRVEIHGPQTWNRWLWSSRLVGAPGPTAALATNAECAAYE